LPKPEFPPAELPKPRPAEASLPGTATPCPAEPEAGVSTPFWAVLGGTVMLLLPFGIVGLLVVAMAGMFAYQQVVNISSVLLAGALFLLSGDAGIRAQLWPAFKWGGRAVLVATVPLLILMVSPAGGWMDQHRFALLHATLYIDLAWLAVLALVAWRGPTDARRLGFLLALVVGTSRLMMFPVFLAGGVVTAGANSIILAPVALAGLAAGMLMVTLAGALLAWPALLARRWVRPRKLLAGLALLLALLQLASLILGLRGE
jgi:hypothetical protein